MTSTMTTFCLPLAVQVSALQPEEPEGLVMAPSCTQGQEQCMKVLEGDKTEGQGRGEVVGRAKLAPVVQAA